MYYFIVNPGSQTGKAKTLWADLEKRLKSSDIDYKVYFTEKRMTPRSLPAVYAKSTPR